MNGPTRRLALGLFTGFAVLLASITWYQVIGADRYRSDPRNARTAISLTAKERGVIVSSDGVVLAQSIPDPEDPRSYQRTYPEGEEFTHVVGYTSRLVGTEGLEAAFASELRSRRDLTISDLIAALFGRDLRPLNLQVTLDAGLQETAFQALDGQRGAVVAIDPRTGYLLAYVSSPGYDATPLLGSDAVSARELLLSDPAEPLRDRAGRELYAPGSTFKAIVAAAAFEAGIAGPETEFEDLAEFPLPGSTAVIRNFDGRTCGSAGTVILQLAFVRSCNTIFAQLGVEVGADDIDRTATAMGFNREISFPWNLADAAFPRRDLAADQAALAQSAIGQRDVRASPLVMAMVAAAVANQGQVMIPQLVEQLFDADGETTEVFEPASLGRALSPAGAAVLTQMMERVVTEGTGRRASVSGVRVAGKTGTAEVPGGAPHAWFIGFAPVEDPTIALAVLVESGGGLGDRGTGGTVAAPIAAELISTWVLP